MFIFERKDRVFEIYKLRFHHYPCYFWTSQLLIHIDKLFAFVQEFPEKLIMYRIIHTFYYLEPYDKKATLMNYFMWSSKCEQMNALFSAWKNSQLNSASEQTNLIFHFIKKHLPYLFTG